MLRLIIAAVLASACLAYPAKRDGAPADSANLQSFGPGMMQAMPNMQGMQQPMQAMPAGQFMPFNPNLGIGYKRAVYEDREERRPHSKFNDNKSPFEQEGGLGNFMNFMKENGNLPFANMDGAAADLGKFEPSAEKGQKEGQFRFFDKQQ
uniref:Conotoxin B2 superfamily protein n=1 Tax=Conus litteratus TaxID=89445 RepID=Q2HZ30_CONLT|nr:high frequency protein 1 [Conus litteratus]WLP00774.1 conotoxin precursor B2 superfamily protein [Conus litteratus]